MIALAYVHAVAAGILARVRRTLCGRPCPCLFCREHRAARAAGVGNLARVPERASDGLPFACVTCGARECDSWPSSCSTCRAPGPSRAYLPTLDEQRARRGL